MPVTKSDPTSSTDPATSSTDPATSSTDPVASDPFAPAPDAAAEPAARSYSVGDVARDPSGALVLVVGVSAAEGDLAEIYDTVELHGAGTRYFADDLEGV